MSPRPTRTSAIPIKAVAPEASSLNDEPKAEVMSDERSRRDGVKAERMFINPATTTIKPRIRANLLLPRAARASCEITALDTVD
ncbi:unannotated protein [freshwater metagenome]|uniref:Unannotated protein n=1 Tax=freshwater metagenome TaxID=449393 RepID=A0A6J6L462_9ZZZZ